MSRDCIDLNERFGVKYRITKDPSATRGGRFDPWMLQIPCAGRGVTIYPHDSERLAVEVDYHPRIALRLAALPGVTIHQYGDQERTFLFAVDLFNAVARIVKPHKRRALTTEQKANLVS